MPEPSPKFWVCPEPSCVSEVYASYSSAYGHIRDKHKDREASTLLKFSDALSAERGRLTKLRTGLSSAGTPKLDASLTENIVHSETEPEPPVVVERIQESVIESPPQPSLEELREQSREIVNTIKSANPDPRQPPRLQVSMAERAAGIVEHEEGDERPEEPFVPSVTYTTRGSGGNIPFSAEAVAVYDFFVSGGYLGSAAEFFEEAFWNWFVLTKLDLRLGQVPERLKKDIYASVGMSIEAA